MPTLNLRPVARSLARRPVVAAPPRPSSCGLRHSHSAVHAAPTSPLFTRSRLVMAGLVLGAGLVVGVSQSSPAPPSKAPLHLAEDDDADPLSALQPLVLTASYTHLESLAVSDLVKQYFVYLASSQPALVDAGPWILSKLEFARDHVPLVGPVVWKIFTLSMESTFYSTFVGGPTVPECAPIISQYGQKGVGCLLSYGAEASNDGSASSSTSSGLVQDHIVEACNALRGASKLSLNNSTVQVSDPATEYTIKPTVVAIKLSGLIREPQLLARATSALVSSSAFQRGSILPSDVLFPNSPELSDEDHAVLNGLHEGLRQVCTEAKDGGVRLLVDAEQSWFQPAIDRYVDLLSEEFNRVTPENSKTGPAIPIVHNTYQAYLRTTPPNMAASIARADALGYSFGAKLVRGAYVESERKRHAAAGASGDCVVWNNKAETDACFDKCALVLEQRVARDVQQGQAGEPGTGAVYASHNGTSVRKVLEALRSQGLAVEKDGGLVVDDRVRGRIAFGQLLGMSDNLTSTLTTILAPSDAHSSSPSPLPIVFKWVPYATVDQALPYLIRRANENQSILQSDPTSGRGGATGERRAIGREIRSRMGLSF